MTLAARIPSGAWEMRSRGVPKIVIKRSGDELEYVMRIIVDFNRGLDRIGVIAYGRNICKLADVVAEVRRRLGNSVKIVGWEIDNRRVGGKRETYLYIELAYKSII
jgi:DNA-binding protein